MHSASRLRSTTSLYAQRPYYMLDDLIIDHNGHRKEVIDRIEISLTDI
jgi:hypothetical protein